MRPRPPPSPTGRCIMLFWRVAWPRLRSKGTRLPPLPLRGEASSAEESSSLSPSIAAVISLRSTSSALLLRLRRATGGCVREEGRCGQGGHRLELCSPLCILVRRLLTARLTRLRLARATRSRRARPAALRLPAGCAAAQQAAWPARPHTPARAQRSSSRAHLACPDVRPSADATASQARPRVGAPPTPVGRELPASAAGPEPAWLAPASGQPRAAGAGAAGQVCPRRSQSSQPTAPVSACAWRS
eukprot:scaffold6986_cov66-Phaeocystis_antarctica.AAC.4